MVPVFLLVFIGICFSTYVTEAKVQSCLDDGDSLECEENRAIVGVAVSHGMEASIDILDVNSLDTAEGKVSLRDPLKIRISKSLPVLHYPLIHLHMVPFFPYEEVIEVSNTMYVQGCKDDGENPSCGWTYLGGGVRVPDSQGFCCNKNWDLVIDPESWWRGEMFLGKQSTKEISFSTAHCLRKGDHTYVGYEIDPYIKFFTITITVESGDVSLEFELTPASPIYNSKYDPEVPISPNSGKKAINIRGELIGDFSSYSQAPDLTDKVLYYPLNHDAGEMLLIPEEYVTKTGTECDKVGVDYYLFRQEGNKCPFSRVGHCLSGQLAHYSDHDRQKLASQPGASADYTVSKMSEFRNGEMSFQAGLERVLRYEVSNIENSLLYLEVDAGLLRIIETDAKGVIKEAFVEPFESMSRDGKLIAVIQNVGKIRGNYVITITHCNMNIDAAIPAKSTTLNPEEEITLEFNIYTLRSLDSMNQCLVTLKATDGKEYDSVMVLFDTQSHSSKTSDDLRKENDGSTSSKGKAMGIGQCECNFFDVSCKIIKFAGCWVDITIVVTIVVIVFVLIAAFIVFLALGGGNYLPAMLCFVCKTFGICGRLVGCFTDLCVKEAEKGGKYVKRERRRRGKKKRKRSKSMYEVREKKRTQSKDKRKGKRKKRSKSMFENEKKKKKKKKKRGRSKSVYSSRSSKKRKSRNKMKIKKYVGMCPEMIESYCESGQICYMNVNEESELGRELLGVLKKLLPLPVGGTFCIVGTIGKASGSKKRIEVGGDEDMEYKFVIHEDFLSMTFWYDGYQFVPCYSENECKKIQPEHRGFGLQEMHISTFVSSIPFKDHVVINAPIDL